MEPTQPPAREAIISFGEEMYIRLVTNERGGSKLISRGTKVDPSEPYAAEYNAGIDALENFLLALWCLGVDVGAPEFKSAFDTATMALTDQYPS